MIIKSWLLAMAFLAPAVAAAADEPVCAKPQDLHFAPGTSETTVSAAVSREDFSGGCFTFLARKGQALAIITSTDTTANTAIVVFAPGYDLKVHDDFEFMDGPQLPGAGRDDEAKNVHATLPVSGRYLIMVGPAFGGAAGFTLHVSIH